MKYAILSDIHGNLEALQAVLAEVRLHGVGGYICLGDIVGYGANPDECLETLLALDPVTVLGNHDAAVCGRADLDIFAPLAYRAIIWTMERLSPAGKEYLSTLPLVRTINGFTIVHSNLSSPSDWRYIQSPGDSYSTFAHLTGQVCFFGHSHRPGIYQKIDRWVDLIPESELRLAPGSRYLVNAGSVGQPRDRDPRASFAVYDEEEGKIEIVRVDYPVKRAQRKILAAGLPARLASRLSEGK